VGHDAKQIYLTVSLIHKSENGESLKSIADGTNGNRLEAYPTVRRRVAAVGPR
jgi:hypothetical protein